MSLDRRAFLLASTAASVSAAALASKSLLADEKPTVKQYKKAVKIGMVQHGKTLQDKFALLKELGFDGVELNAPSEVTVEEAKRCIDETGLPVHGVVDSVHWNQRLSDPDPQQTQI